MSATTEVSPFPPMESELVTDRLRLRPWLLADSGAARTLWLERDPRVPARRRIDDAGRPTESEIGELIEAQLDESAASGLSVLAIEPRAFIVEVSEGWVVMGEGAPDLEE